MSIVYNCTDKFSKGCCKTTCKFCTPAVAPLSFGGLIPHAQTDKPLNTCEYRCVDLKCRTPGCDPCGYPCKDQHWPTPCADKHKWQEHCPPKWQKDCHEPCEPKHHHEPCEPKCEDPCKNDYAHFYGLTSGIGSTVDDYQSPILVKTAVGNGRVPFPRNGASDGCITRIDNSSFRLGKKGSYKVEVLLHIQNQSQIQLELDGVDVVESASIGRRPTVLNTIIKTKCQGSVLAVVNPVGNSNQLNIIQGGGGEVHANAEKIIITYLG